MLWLQGEADLAARRPDLAAIVQHNRTHAAASSPPWEVRLWSEEDVLRESWPRLDPGIAAALQPVLASCPSHAARSDVLRLVVLTTEGGLYMDTDMLLLRDDFGWLLHSPGDEAAAHPSLVLLHDTTMTDTDAWLFGSRGSNCFMAATPAHPFMSRLLGEIAASKPYPLRGEGGVVTAAAAAASPDVSSAARRWTLRTTGPELLERVLTSPEWWSRACAPGSDIRLLPCSLVQLHRKGLPDAPAPLGPSALERSVRAGNPSAAAVHFSDNSWVGSDVVALKRAGLAVREWAYHNWLVVQLVLLLAVVVITAGAALLVRRVVQTRDRRVASLNRKLRRTLNRKLRRAARRPS